MYARALIGQVKPVKRDEMDDAIRIYHDSIVSSAQEQAGFNGALLFTNPHTGKAMSITLWETEADMMESEADGYYQDQITKIASFLAGPGIVDRYQLSVHTGSQSE